MKTYDFPVWGTQGGGLVREVDGKYLFVEAPKDFPELTVGSEMPEEWGLAAANDLALNECREINDGFDEFFEIAFGMHERGEVSLATIGSFFPEEVKARAR